MYIITTDNKFIYDTDDPFIISSNQFTCTDVNTTSGFRGNIRQFESLSRTIETSNNAYVHILAYRPSAYNWYNFYFVLEVDITKDLSDNIAYYNIVDILSKADPCINYPASKNSIHDSFTWFYISGAGIQNGYGPSYAITFYDENNQQIAPSKPVTIKATSYRYPLY